MKRIIAQTRKELTQTFRDRMTLTLALVLPLAQMWLIGAAVSLSVSDLRIVVRDVDQSPLSRRYAEALRASLTFQVVSLPADEQPERALDDGRAHAAIVIPRNFDRDLRRGAGAEVQWLLDGADANTATNMRNHANTITQAFNAQFAPTGKQAAVSAKERFWFNPGRDSDQFVGPGIFAVGLALFPPLLAALAVSREGEQKTILQVYVSSITAFEYLSGKIFAFLIIAAAEWALTLVLAVLLFGLWFKGDPTPFLLSSFLFLFCSVAFGAMIGARIPDRAAAIQAIQNTCFLLSYLLSGFIFPVSNIPAGVRWVSYLIPARYYIEVARDAFVRGGGWPAVWTVPLALAALSAVFFASAWARMRHMQVEA
ncbi:MAG TPA: ABC transporter permease [Pyrinomonadaceae bacterium]|nr:ABC transporter permease [Pyrinomonadaceae bacterium]